LRTSADPDSAFCSANPSLPSPSQTLRVPVLVDVEDHQVVDVLEAHQLDGLRGRLPGPDQRGPLLVLLDHDREIVAAVAVQVARVHRLRRGAVEPEQRRERQAALLAERRRADGLLALGEDDHLGLAVAVEVRNAQRLGVRQGRERAPAPELAVAALQVDRDLRGAGLGHDDVEALVAVDVADRHRARLAAASDLEGVYLRGAERHDALRRLRRHLERAQQAGRALNDQHLGAVARRDVVEVEHAPRRRLERDLRAERAIRAGEPHAHRARRRRRDVEQVGSPVAVDVEQVDGAHALDRVRHLARLGQRPFLRLEVDRRVALRQQRDVVALVTVEVADRDPVPGRLHVLDREALGALEAALGVAVGHDEFVRLAVVRHVEVPVPVEVAGVERPDLLLRQDLLALEELVVGQVVRQLLAGLRLRRHRIPAPQHDLDLGLGVVDDEQVLQAVLVDVGGGQARDAAGELVDLEPGEPVRVGRVGPGGREQEGQREQEEKRDPALHGGAMVTAPRPPG
jgi:hypothetical protein